VHPTCKTTLNSYARLSSRSYDSRERGQLFRPAELSLTTAGSHVAPSDCSAMGALGSIMAGPVGDVPYVGGVLGVYFPTDTVGKFTVEMVPILYVTALPLFLALLAVVGLCDCRSGGAMKFGARTVMRKVMIAARANARMGLGASNTKLLASIGFKKGGPKFMQPTASAIESGMAFQKAKGSKAPDQSKGKKEEAAIKKKVTPTKK
jgi:hypothetical protein